MVYRIDELQCRSLEFASNREWMLPNGIGGFAMGTVSGINTRRYHGHLIAATKPPTERTLLLASIEATVQFEGASIGFSTNQYQGAVHPEGYQLLEQFEAGEQGVRWVFRLGQSKIEKSLTIHPGRNTVTIAYRNDSDRTVVLSLRPLIASRSYHGNFVESPSFPNVIHFPHERTVIEHEGVELSVSHLGAARTPVQGWYYRFEHRRELERGLDPRDDLFCPCELQYMLGPGEQAVLVASADGDDTPRMADREPYHAGVALREKLEAATQRFVVETPSRTSILAGYPWFTDWGRDTMISLPGICLATGKFEMARKILDAYASQMSKGIIPNRFVEDGEEQEYNTVDATLWFANAVYKTLEAEWDHGFAERMLEKLSEVFVWHTKGTRYGIKVDPSDGLLSQGQPGIQLTWMDAKIGEWVVTPRHGKPVEINGLWINALRVMEWLAGKVGKTKERYAKAAEKAEKSFNEKFWCERRGHYFDTVDPDDVSLRPNQLIAISLPFGPAKGDRAKSALAVCERELLTPVGLRTLGPSEPGYKGEFKGGLAELDAAYHQGTVWPWLLGPFITAYVKLTGDRKTARSMLSGVKDMLEEYGIGGIAEVYDGNAPHSPGGCPWQAWSAAELLRVWVEDCGE